MLNQFLLIITIVTTKSVLCLDLEESAAADEPVVVRGIAGQSAALPCHVDQNECGEVYFLTWTKLERDERWSRIYIFADNIEKPMRDLSGRARFTLNKNEAQLSINHLKSGDETVYKCDVTYVAGGSAPQTQRPGLGKCPSLTYVRLEIIVKPSKAYIEYKNSELENGSEIEGIEGNLLRLVCIVIGGKPMPSVSWKAIDANGNSDTIDVKNSSFADNITRLELTKQLSRTDLKTRYECHVEHPAIKNNTMDAYAMIDVSVGAKSLEIVGPSDQIREGDVAVMQCIAYSSKPEVQIVWKNGSQIIDSVVKSEVEANSDGSTLNTRSYLELRVSRFDHLNQIECQAINIAMKEAIKQSIELKIQYPPIVVMEPKNGMTVNESSDTVSFYCSFNSNPTELIENETKWYKDDQLLDTDNSQHYISSLSGYPMLTIVNPMRSDSGAYYCSVANNIGIGRPEEPLILNVLFPPSVNLQIYPNPEQGFAIKEGDDIRLICDIIEGNPLNATKVKWMNTQNRVSNELTAGENSPQTEITWLSITRSLSGNYTCQASSEAGVGPISNVVEVDVSYPPSKALIRQLNGINSIKGQNLTLECIVSDLGKPSTSIEYQWESEDEIPFDTKGPVLHLTDLNLSNRGNISCAVANEVGIGPKAIFQVIPLTGPTIIDSLPPIFGVNEKIVNSKNTSVNESLSCRVECYPICQVFWYKNTELIDNSSMFYTIKNSILPEEIPLNRLQSVVSTLIFNLSALSPLDRNLDSNVQYSCVSSDNGIQPGAPVKSETTFMVEYPPENLRLRPKGVDVIEDDIPPEILCESDALPPASYRWLSYTSADKLFGVIADTPLLSLNTSIQRDRAGTYTCIAINRHGENRVDLLINVLYAPTCKLYESRTDNEKEIELICEVTDANPNNELTFIWSLNNSSLNETMNDQIVRYEGLKSKIIIPVDNESLFGSWTCIVANEIGQSDPNCTLYVSLPIPAPPMTEQSIILISIIIIAIIITFIVILLLLICLMRRRRRKQDSTQVSQTRENPDGSRSPTPSSLSSHLSSNQVITYKKVEMNPRFKRNDKVMDVIKNEGIRKLPPNESQDLNGETANREMYENMPFQRKTQNCMLLSGAYIPQYNENIAQITRELRRTQSARYHNHLQPFGVDMDDVLYADMYDDVKSGKVKDPRIKPPLPPKGEPTKVKPPKRPPKNKKAL